MTNGAQALIRTLVDSGVTACFTNPGTSEMHFVAALDTVPEMRGVLALFERVATGAADGYARMIVGDHAAYHAQYDAQLQSDIETVARNVSPWVRTSTSPQSVARDAADAVAASLGRVPTRACDGPARRPGPPRPRRHEAARVVLCLPGQAELPRAGRLRGSRARGARGRRAQGLPVAVGAAIACPDRPVLALEADGSALYTIQSLWTMAREGLDVTVLVFNNRSYGILNVELARVGAKAAGPRAKSHLDLSRPDVRFVELAKGLVFSDRQLRVMPHALRALTAMPRPLATAVKRRLYP